MTTNGLLLPQRAEGLKRAGLKRVTVSLDSLDEAVFQSMNDVGVSVERVLAGIQAAEQADLRPIKINMVVKRGVNQDSILPMARHFRGTGHILRFIEYMDVGRSNGWRLDDVVTAAEILAILRQEFDLEPAVPNYRGEVANRYRYRDGAGEIGIIASVSQPFCGDCTRARLSADGMLYTCLFAVNGHNLMALLRGGASDAEIARTIERIWLGRTDRYSEIRSSETVGLPKIEMSYIGG
jgi:cyclic pyranopterin phosphate synthase